MKKITSTLALSVILLGAISPPVQTFASVQEEKEVNSTIPESSSKNENKILSSEEEQTLLESKEISEQNDDIESPNLSSEDDQSLLGTEEEARAAVSSNDNYQISEQTESSNDSVSSDYLIPDEALRKIVNAKLGKLTSYSPSIEELESITGSLSLTGSQTTYLKVDSWEGLEYLKGITGLSFMYVETSSEVLTKIKSLENLTTISFNAITFTGTDASMKVNGKDVGIQQEVDFSPLGEVTNLQNLYMTYMNTEIKGTTGYPRLKGNLTGLGSLSHLKRLDIGQLGETDDNSFKWIENMTSLEQVNIYETTMNSVTSISTLPNLTSLNVAANKIRDFSPIVDKDYFTGASGNNYILDVVSMYSNPEMGERLVNIDNLVTVGEVGMSSASIQRYTSYNNFTVKSTSFEGMTLDGVIQMGDLISLNNYNWQTGQYDKWETSIQGTAIPYTVTTNNNKTISGYAYVNVTDKAQAEIKAKDSTIYVGDSWSPEDNFVNAIDENGMLILKFDSEKIEVSGTVDITQSGTYDITYKCGGASAKATVTVKDREVEDQWHIHVHDSTLKIGDAWSPEDNFDDATDAVGNSEEFSDIIVDGSVNTTKAGTYEVTYTIPEEHRGKSSTIEGHYSATAKIVVSEEDSETDGSDNNGESGSEEVQDKDKDGNSNTDISGPNNSEVTANNENESNIIVTDKEGSETENQTLPQTGEVRSYFVLMVGITLLALGALFTVMRLKNR
ncbi:MULTISPECIES: bacterial Ig-like domain-containing protein [Lactococcus]|uniref:bacterial Ig-like domain-containing protein n=1 Tax=Lactococcus TaxID=1357 RepID=UPI001A8CF2EA|nr:bacterial Ig-like domain-containing protein [Lactococcus sp. LG1267]QSR04001.1 bacterial Ig-like domain-containing protein [Lactococcus sp. LG1267]